MNSGKCDLDKLKILKNHGFASTVQCMVHFFYLTTNMMNLPLEVP